MPASAETMAMNLGGITAADEDFPAGRTLGGADAAKGMANLEYQLEGGVPGSSNLAGTGDVEGPMLAAAVGGPAIAGAVRAALSAGASLPAIAARLNMSLPEFKLVLAELGIGGGIITGAETLPRPPGVEPSMVRRGAAAAAEYFNGDGGPRLLAGGGDPQMMAGDRLGLPMAVREHGGLAGLADRGRYGDSMLVHMAPDEVAGLASLTQNGVTINPDTGLPEMFNLRALLPTIATIGAGLIPGVGPLAAAAMSGLATAATTEGDMGQKLSQGVLAGMGSYGVGKLMGALGGAGAAADPNIATGIRGEGQYMLDEFGKTVPFQDYSADYLNAGLPQSGLDNFGFNTEDAYQKAMGPAGRALRATPPTSPGGWDQVSYPPTVGGPGGVSFRQIPQTWDDAARNEAVYNALNPSVVQAQGAAAYADAPLSDRLGYAAKGLGEVDLESWSKAAPGKIPIGDLASPLAMAATGILGTLPQEEYDDPIGRPSYVDTGPHFAPPRRRRELPPGYIPGVSPQFTSFGMGGTRGKTVQSGLPTLYAQSGTSPAESGEDPSGGIGNVEGGPSPTGGGIAFSSPAAPAPKTGYGSGNITMTDLPTPEIHAHEMDIISAQEADANSGLLDSLFDFTVPQGVVDPETGQPSIEDSVNPGAVVGTVLGLLTGLPGLGMAGAALGRGSMGLHAGQNTATPDVDPGEIGGPSEDDLRLRTAPVLQDPSLDGEGGAQEEARRRREAAAYGGRTLGMPPPTYVPGVDPQFSYFAQAGTDGMTIEESIDVEAAAEIPSGVAATTGIMQGASVEAQGDVEARLGERSVEEPQNPRERAVYDRAVLALQNELEPEVAQRAIDAFLEVFGPEALHTLQEMVRGDRETGGTVETANGETTVPEGGLQGPDVIAGKIVDPVTGEETANLRVGENEYIEPAISLARRAQVAGLPPTPENGAMLRGEEERMLQQAVG